MVSAGVLQGLCTISAEMVLLSCQGKICKMFWIPADSSQAARPPQGGQAPGCSCPPDSRHRDACACGELLRRQQFIRRQFAKRPPALLHCGARTLPSRRNPHVRFLDAAEKPVDRTGGDPFAMMFAGTFVSGDDSGCDPLPQQAHAHPEEPRHMGDRPHLPFCRSQTFLNLSPPVANPVQNP